MLQSKTTGPPSDVCKITLNMHREFKVLRKNSNSISLILLLARLLRREDRNGRSRLLFLQLELRRLKIACGTMNFNNNNNVTWLQSVQFSFCLLEGMYSEVKLEGKHEGPNTNIADVSSAERPFAIQRDTNL